MREDCFYKDGLRFTCLRCGKCCAIKDGVVYITANDVQSISSFLGISREKFMCCYTRRDDKHRVLKDFPNGQCIFYCAEQGCSIYPVRPAQCKAFPFWKSNLRSKQSWDSCATDCPGMNIGRLYDAEEIETIARGDGT